MLLNRLDRDNRKAAVFLTSAAFLCAFIQPAQGATDQGHGPLFTDRIVYLKLSMEQQDRLRYPLYRLMFSKKRFDDGYYKQLMLRHAELRKRDRVLKEEYLKACKGLNDE